MREPLVSIITPAYNCSRFIGETIHSVLDQTYSNFEMIIVDDCSKDDTWTLLKRYEKVDARIKPYQLEENSGAALARNYAIEQAKGTYIAFLDSDDLWYPEKLEKQLQFMEENDYEFTFTNYEMMDENGGNLNKEVICPSSIDYEGLLKNTTIGCLTVMINSGKIGKPVMPNLQPEDTALWLKILRNGERAYCLEDVVARYRIVGNSASSNKLKVAKKMWIVYRQSEKLPLLKTTWYFMNYAYNAVRKHYL